jgi:hypothetical protein
MSEITISSYSAYLTVACLGLINLFSSNDVPFYTNFKFIDWIIICGGGAISAAMQIFRTRAT